MPTAQAFSIDDVLKIQRDRVRRGEFRPLGTAQIIVIEAAKGAMVPQREAQTAGVRLDFMGKGPLLGLSYDQKDLLICSPIFRLPDIPDPAWVPKKAGKKAPMIAQKLVDRASGILTGSTFLVFQPVWQIMYRAVGFSAFKLVECATDEADGTKVALLIDPASGEAHFYGGRFILS